MWIRIERQKTKSECRIRLLNVPIQIMEKYKHERTDDKIFKLKTLKTIDENLKTIAKKCGIESRLCYHMGRHHTQLKCVYHRVLRMNHSAK